MIHVALTEKQYYATRVMATPDCGTNQLNSAGDFQEIHDIDQGFRASQENRGQKWKPEKYCSNI